jgi:hypothetical protein
MAAKKLKTYKKTAVKPKPVNTKVLDGSGSATPDGAASQGQATRPNVSSGANKAVSKAQPQSTVRDQSRLVMEVVIPSRPTEVLPPIPHLHAPRALRSRTPRLPTPRLPTSRSPTSRSLTLRSPTLHSPTPRSPTPRSPTPRSPTLRSPTPRSPTPRSPTPRLSTPRSAMAQSPHNSFRRYPLFLESGEDEDDVELGTLGRSDDSNGPGDPDALGDIEGEDAQDGLSGGRLSLSQVSEIHAIVAKMHDEIEAKAKQWKRSTESLLRVGNVLVNTKERRHGGNSWNSFHNAFEKDPVENRPHHEYVQVVIRPAYLKLIEEHGGQDSAEWKAKAKQLVEDHQSLKAAGAVAIAQTPSDLGKVMQQITKRWEDDLKWAATMNVHGMFILVSGNPDAAASKHNAMICGSNAMHQWATDNLPVKSSLLPLIHSYILMATGQPVMLPKRPQPKDMHKMRKEVSDEIQRVVLQCGAPISRVPWSNMPSFLANHNLRFENWPALSEFPSMMDLTVEYVRTESWKTLWEAFFAKEALQRVKVSSLSDVASANEGRLPRTTILVSDHLGHALISVADTQKGHLEVSNTSPLSPEQSIATSAVGDSTTSSAGPSTMPPGSIPTPLSSSVLDKQGPNPRPEQTTVTTKKRKPRDSRGDGRKRTKKSAKTDLAYKSSEFISEEHDADEPQVTTTSPGSSSVPSGPLSVPSGPLLVPSGSLSDPFMHGMEYNNSGFGILNPLPDEVLQQLSGMDWSRASDEMDFGAADPLLPHLGNWGDMPQLGYPSSSR